MAEQVVKMVIKVDLQCRRCYKKIKKILCEIPQVKDQSFDEKQNKVTITVVSCRPEEVRQKICRKGRDCILGIDIIAPEKVTKDESSKKTTKTGEDVSSKETKKPGATQDGPAKKPVPPPPVYVMGLVNVCPPCHNLGCGWLCPCICHCGRPPMCDDGCGRPAHECRCGRPPMCHDGCGRPPHECRCGRPPMCHDGCGRPAPECRCGRPPMCQDGCGRPAHECRCGRPPMCQYGCGRPAHECRCGRPPMCQDGCGRPAHECRCGRPPMCQDGCGRPAHECRCWRPIYCGRPPVCTNAGHECESSCSLM